MTSQRWHSSRDRMVTWTGRLMLSRLRPTDEDGHVEYHAGRETVRRGAKACGTIDAVK